jgi:N-methylhydantoinase A
VPPAPGAFSALGLVATDLKREYSRTFYAALDAVDPARIAAAIRDMEVTATAMLEAAHIPPERRALLRSADLRYRRQAYELTVPLEEGPIDRAALDRLARHFHERHRQTYGHANEAEGVQLVNLRLSAIGQFPQLSLARRGNPRQARRHERPVWFAETGFLPCPVLWRDGLAAGEKIAGPAVIEALDATIVVPPSWLAAVDARGYLRMRRR